MGRMKIFIILVKKPYFFLNVRSGSLKEHLTCPVPQPYTNHHKVGPGKLFLSKLRSGSGYVYKNPDPQRLPPSRGLKDNSSKQNRITCIHPSQAFIQIQQRGKKLNIQGVPVNIIVISVHDQKLTLLCFIYIKSKSYRITCIQLTRFHSNSGERKKYIKIWIYGCLHE